MKHGMKKLAAPIVLMRKTTKGERADEIVPMNKFLNAIRWFIVVVCIGFLLMGALVWRVVQLTDSNSNTISQNKIQQNQLHQDRINEDASLQKQISDAVCTFVDPVPPGNLKVDALRKKYGCTYTPAKATPKPAAKPTPSATAKASIKPNSVPPPTPAATLTLTPVVPSSAIPSRVPTTTAPLTPPRIVLPTLLCIPSLGVCL